MKIQIVFFVVFFSSLAANPSDVLRQCETRSDCGANYYCLNTYCERCISCDAWFNRQPAQSLYGVPICARVDDDCGVCLPGYQAHDYTDHRRSMKCFSMYETVYEQPPQLKSNLHISNPFPVVIVTTAMTLLLVVITILIVRLVFHRRLKYQVQVLKNCATILSYPEQNAILVDEEDSFIGKEVSETSIHLFPIHRNLDDLPTYEQAVGNLRHEQYSKEENIALVDRNDTHREFSAESNLSSEQTAIALGISTHGVDNSSVELVHSVNRIINKDSGFSSII